MLEQLTRAEVQPRLLRSVIIITERNGHDTVQKRPQFAGRVVAGEHIGADTQRKAVDIGKRTLEQRGFGCQFALIGDRKPEILQSAAIYRAGQQKPRHGKILVSGVVIENVVAAAVACKRHGPLLFVRGESHAVWRQQTAVQRRRIGVLTNCPHQVLVFDEFDAAQTVLVDTFGFYLRLQGVEMQNGFSDHVTPPRFP